MDHANISWIRPYILSTPAPNVKCMCSGSTSKFSGDLFRSFSVIRLKKQPTDRHERKHAFVQSSHMRFSAVLFFSLVVSPSFKMGGTQVVMSRTSVHQSGFSN